jgi:hypothetical protein
MEHAALKSWLALGTQTSDQKLMLMAKSLCQNLETEENIEEGIARWFGLCSQFQKLQTTCLYHLYKIPQESVTHGDETAEYCLFPMCKGVPPQYKQVFPSILKVPDLLFVNTLLPTALQHQWRFCFSTAIQGESFAKMLGLIVDKGPTVIIVKDRNGNVFGGFASENFTVGPNFRGKHHKIVCCNKCLLTVSMYIIYLSKSISKLTEQCKMGMSIYAENVLIRGILSASCITALPLEIHCLVEVYYFRHS